MRDVELKLRGSNDGVRATTELQISNAAKEEKVSREGARKPTRSCSVRCLCYLARFGYTFYSQFLEALILPERIEHWIEPE